MHKKCLLSVLVFSCLIASDNQNNQNNPISSQKVKKIYSVFSDLDDDLAKEIPEQVRTEALERYKAKEKARVSAEIEKYYENVLIDELEIPGSIEKKLNEKIIENNMECKKHKDEICTCNRKFNDGWFSSDPTETAVKRTDAKLDNNNTWLNNKYRKAACERERRNRVIQTEVGSSEIQYGKKGEILLNIINSLNECGLDMACNQNNGFAEFHLAAKYRDGLSAKIFADAVKACEKENAATEQELRKIWESSSRLKPRTTDIAEKNARIDYLINPDNQQEIEVKKQEKKAQELEEQQRREEQQRAEQQKAEQLKKQRR